MGNNETHCIQPKKTDVACSRIFCKMLRLLGRWDAEEKVLGGQVYNHTYRQLLGFMSEACIPKAQFFAWKGESLFYVGDLSV